MDSVAAKLRKDAKLISHLVAVLRRMTRMLQLWQERFAEARPIVSQYFKVELIPLLQEWIAELDPTQPRR
jgi:hypothetical protein